MCARDLYTSSGATPRQGEASLNPRAKQRGFLAVKFLVGSLLSVLVSALALLAFNGDKLRPVRYSALDGELNKAMEPTRREISQRPVPIVIIEDNDCVVFEFDQNGDGTISEDEIGAYRHEMIGGIGVVALWIGEGETNCDDPDP